MGELIAFNPPHRAGRSRPTRPGDVVLFTGVRRERIEDSAPPKSVAPRKEPRAPKPCDRARACSEQIESI